MKSCPPLSEVSPFSSQILCKRSLILRFRTDGWGCRILGLELGQPGLAIVNVTEEVEVVVEEIYGC